MYLYVEESWQRYVRSGQLLMDLGSGVHIWAPTDSCESGEKLKRQKAGAGEAMTTVHRYGVCAA
jgi:hypothetical protein